MTHHEWEHVQEATQAVRTRWSGTPLVGIVLGTGLGALAGEIDAEATIPYPEIPHFPRSTVESHKGQLVCGTLAGQSVVAMEGRFHLYEGYTAAQVTFPIRVMKELGCRYLVVSNAGGGLNPMHAKGDLMVIDDHINLLGVNPLIGPNDARLGVRFPDLIEPYDQGLQKLALRAALEENIVAHRGVYVAVTGPNLETRAEYRYLRGIGADVVGMSTVPEVLVAVHAGMRVLGFSIITDLCLPDALVPVSLEEIIAVAEEAEGKLRTIVRRVLEQLT
ncbi:purine-nucleoside phosphorylase [Singulisphaera acidiphila]|uniref:Purine nucleoside phosphorylase n=1 Tax=Singulisphaera acidiphila (strain ATCC BAA-1392 / DSM 18658 / VKM B-2454 / MOB10) TaxID=886293 RepID=L0DAJ2_SINAD|nr:purine-nucleoside phosphorylase [Singulisphaera acidiphila]AGA25691.1 purine nucleoside phosphorylase I, inosine and guanosine-specific [Singulisphaera acidiphila DSM 18658]